MGFRYTYNPSTSKWSLLTINAKKKKMGGKKRRAKQAATADPDAMAVDEDVDMDAGAPEPEDDESDDEQVCYKIHLYGFSIYQSCFQDQKMALDGKTEGGDGSEAPFLPLTRSNAMIAVLKNTLYM